MTHQDGRRDGRPSLQGLLIDETIRRWTPAEDLSKSLAIPRPQTPDELEAWLYTTIGLRFPKVRVCPNHSTPWDALCDAYFARSPVVVWKASRAFGGKTNLMAALAFAEAVTLRASVSIVGGSGEQSERVHEYLRDFWKRPRAPIAALSSDPASKRSRMIWGNSVTALTASRTAVSGPHPQRLRVDEVDLVTVPLLDQALGQPMSKDGVEANVLLSSAHYTADGTLTEVLKRAADKGWRVHEWCWRETQAPHGWLAQSEIARQMAVVTAEMWRTQYDLQEPTAEGRAIDPEKVERMFRGLPIAGLGEEFPYAEFEPPVEGASYAHGADWARTRDFVEIATLRDDVYPLRLVAYQRFRRRPTPYILAQWEYQTQRYPGEMAHDATGGGTYLADFLAEPVEDVVMVGMVRRNLFVDYVVAVEHEAIVAPRPAVLHRQHKFCRNDDLFKVGGHPPDGVVAMSMAYKASSRKPLRLANAADQPRRVVVRTDPDPVSAAPATVVQQEGDALDRALDFLGKVVK